jgi:serine/threonine protein kinase
LFITQKWYDLCLSWRARKQTYASASGRESVSQSDGYRLVQQLGNGLAGGVFLAETATGSAAIRQFQTQAEPGSAEWHSYREHFLQGARQAASLGHPRIVSVIEVIDEGVEAYVAMEYVPNETLAAVIGREFFTPEKANYLLRLVAIALDYAHQNGVTHGDVKPSNIFIMPQGMAKIGDFAISPRARRGRQGDLPAEWVHPCLTPEHILSPQSIGPRSDQYSLAAIAYHLYTGNALFAGQPDLGPAIVRGAIPAPSGLRRNVSRSTDASLLKALSRNPQQRYASCLEFVERLEASLSPEEIAAPTEKSQRKVIYAGFGGLAAVVIIAAMVWPHPQPKPKPLVQQPAAAAAPEDNEKPAKQPVRSSVGKKTNSQVSGQTDRGSIGAGDTDSSIRVARRAPFPDSGPQTSPPPTTRTGAVVDPGFPFPVAVEDRVSLSIFSRTKPIEPGLSFSVKDPTLGELAAGDLKVAVSVNGPLPKGQLSLLWMLDGVPMDLKTVTVKAVEGRGLTWAEYGNEPTPGTYRVVLTADKKVLKDLTFRITP